VAIRQDKRPLGIQKEKERSVVKFDRLLMRTQLAIALAMLVIVAFSLIVK
jgi:hypothetical protein